MPGGTAISVPSTRSWAVRFATPTRVVADLVRGHITSLKTVIDAQAANDPAVED